jgi:hypothetical protein
VGRSPGCGQRVLGGAQDAFKLNFAESIFKPSIANLLGKLSTSMATISLHPVGDKKTIICCSTVLFPDGCSKCLSIWGNSTGSNLAPRCLLTALTEGQGALDVVWGGAQDAFKLLFLNLNLLKVSSSQANLLGNSRVPLWLLQ